jgi:hypothetical protein
MRPVSLGLCDTCSISSRRATLTKCAAVLAVTRSSFISLLLLHWM